MATLSNSIETTARESLGFETLRPGQKAAVESILAGRDTLVVQPTGSGKSAIYQIAGLLIDGPSVIVSPLIALQKDQVDSINTQLPGEAALVNSTQRISEIRDRLARLRQGALEFIFLAPEQLRKPETVDQLRRAGVSLFVVDEAHCISQWGHDFRPDYLRLGAVIEELGHPRVLALTATASPLVRREIVERLRMRDPRIFVRGFDRPNIFLRVDRFDTPADKRDALLQRVLFADKPGIVYVGARRAAEEIMRALREAGVKALFYHGGMARKQRDAAHERFMSGEVPVIVATSAFGMGIDKPDIRFVYHHDPPESLDEYYQEIGRAGRDGQRSDAVLFFREPDIGAQAFKAGEGKLDAALLERLAHDPEAQLGLSKRKLAAAMQRLEDVGAIETAPDGKVQTREGVDLSAAAREAAAEQERRRKTKRERLEKMRAYADASSCRRELLLAYLGDALTGPCGFCDNCEAAQAGPESAEGTRREVA